MIKLLLLIITLIAGLVIAPELAGNQGYVLISVANQTIEMSFTTLIAIVVAGFTAFFVLEFIIRTLLSMPKSTLNWFSSRKAKKAREMTNTGLIKMLEGDWKQAEKFMVKGANSSDAPLVNFLAAAEAAQGRGDVESRDHYLQQAADLGSDNLAIAITRAKLQFRQEQYEEALASIQGLIDNHPRNTILLTILKDCYLKLNDWQALLRLLPDLKKAKVITEAQASALEVQAESGLMVRIAHQQGTDSLLAHWNGLPRHAKQDTALVTCLVEQLVTNHADTDAYEILGERLKKDTDDSLIGLVPRLSLSDYHPAIAQLQDLLRHDENSAVTQSALGQLYYRQNKWAEAKAHFEKALAIRSDVTDYAWLVKTLEKLNDATAANSLSRKALSAALEHKQ